MAQLFDTLQSTLAAALKDDVTASLQPEQRLQLLGSIDALRASIAPPEVALQGLCWGFHNLVSTKIAMGMGVFDAYAAHGHKAMTLDELDRATKGSVELLARIMRIMNTSGIVKEVAAYTWAPLPLAVALVSNSPAAGFVHFAEFELKPSSGLYAYLEKTGFRNPADAFNGPFQGTMQTSKHFLDYLDTLPDAKNGFNQMMGAVTKFRGQDWFEFFPVHDRFGDNLAETLLVDIGGNLGHDSIALRNRFPALPGRVVVQDLPSVIGTIAQPMPHGIEAMVHDMFTPQPIKGARAYYLRNVFHDWPDRQVLQALGHIKDAMGPDSVLLVNDNIVPDTNAPPMSSNVDYFMLDLWSSQERTEEQWQALLREGGFSVTKVWKPRVQELVPLALFEAVPAR